MIPAHYYSCIVAQFEQTNMENIDGDAGGEMDIETHWRTAFNLNYQ